MVCNLFILLFKPSSCNGPETELKCKNGFRTYINNICILSYTDSWCLVPFCINISGDSPHRMCLCFDFRNTLIYGSRKFLHKVRPITNRLPVTAKLGRMNEASRWNFFVGRLHVSIEENKRALLLRIETNR